MGAVNKLLLPLGDTTMLGAVVRTLISAGLDVTVVLGHEAERVRESLSGVRTVVNHDFATGLGGTISLGVQCSPAADAYLVALGDMPGLNLAAVVTLVEAARPDRIIVPVYASEPERTGHPVLFGANFRDELVSLVGESGARSIIQSNAMHLVRIEVPGQLIDIDTVETYDTFTGRKQPLHAGDQ